jgi:hypothetical protein
VRQALEQAPIADCRDDEVLVADAPAGAEQVDRLEHGLEVVGRLAHPMKTTLVTGRKVRASATWATISALPNWRSRPPTPVMQNTQPTAQPTWLDTHRPPRGSSTASTERSSTRPTSRRRDPSLLGSSARSVASACSSASSAGSAVRSASGRKSAGRRRPLDCDSPRAHRRSTRSSWIGRAPRARRRWRRASMCMAGTAAV